MTDEPDSPQFAGIEDLADTSKDQYFLTAPDKLAIIREAAGIRPTDRVVEIGSGVGTVAQALPRSANLTLIELDYRLINYLRRNLPYGIVLNGDGVELLRTGAIYCDVLLSNLPPGPTDSLISILPALQFRIAVLAAASMEQFGPLRDRFECLELATIGGSDFTPPQPETSILVRIVPK